jgi:phosphatidylglycerophosphate synthase
MLSRYRTLLREVRASYPPEKAAEERRGERLAYWFYRPLSFYVTPLFLLLGWTADGISVLQLALAVGMVAAAWIGPIAGPVAIVALALAIQVLDCVDGNVARATRFYSRAGAMMEGLCTQLFWTCYFIAIGVAAHNPRNWLSSRSLEIGLAVAVLMLVQRGFEDTFASNFDERVRWTPPALDGSQWSWAGKFLEQVAAFGGLLVAAILGWLEWLVAAVALYQVLVLIPWCFRFAVALKGQMRQRRSP